MVPTTTTTTTAMLLVWIPVLVLLLVVDPLLPAQLQLVVLPQVAAIRRDPLSATTTTTITATLTTADGSNQQHPNTKDYDIHTNKRRRRLTSLVDAGAGAGRVPVSTNTTTTTTATAGSSSLSLSPPPQRGLIGTKVAVPIPTSPDEHLVTQLPLLDKADFHQTQHWSGLLPVNEHGDGYLFYWLFAPDPETVTARNLPDNDIPLGT